MRKLLIPFLLAAMTLSACATVQRLDASGDVHDLLVAIRDDDRQTFDNHVDRRALKASIESRLIRETSKSEMSDRLKVVSALLAPTLADVAGEVLIQPKVFRGVADYYGYTPDKPIPDRLVIAGALKAMPDGRVCVTRKKDGPCILVFTNEGGQWKLSGFEGEISDLRTRAAR